MLQVIRRLLTVIIWTLALIVSLGFFAGAHEGGGFDGAPWAVRAVAVGALLLAYVANKITNWIFAD